MIFKAMETLGGGDWMAEAGHQEPGRVMPDLGSDMSSLLPEPS